MTPDEPAMILADLARLGIAVRADGDKLRLRPKSAMTAKLVKRIVEHKGAILALLRGDCPQSDPEATEPVTGRETNGDAPGERSPEDRGDAGHVPEGWRPSAWRDRLHQLADRCEWLHPTRADQLREWADAVGGKPLA